MQPPGDDLFQGVLPSGAFIEGAARAGVTEHFAHTDHGAGGQPKALGQTGAQQPGCVDLGRGRRRLFKVPGQTDVDALAGPFLIRPHRAFQGGHLKDASPVVHHEIIGDARIAALDVGVGDQGQIHIGPHRGVVDHQMFDLFQIPGLIGHAPRGHLVHDVDNLHVVITRGRGGHRAHLKRGAIGLRALVPKPGLHEVHQIQLQGEGAGRGGGGDGGVKSNRLAHGHILGQIGAHISHRVQHHEPVRIVQLEPQTHRVAAAPGQDKVAPVFQRHRGGDLLAGLNGLGQAHLPPFDAIGQVGRGCDRRGRWGGRCPGPSLAAPFIVKGQGLAEVLDHPLLALDIPTVELGPAIENQGPDLLVARLFVPMIDLPIGPLHPADVAVEPGVVLVGFGDIDGQMAHVGRYRVHKIPIGAKLIAAMGKRGVHFELIVDEVQFRAMGIGMQAEAIAVFRPQKAQDVLKIGHPIAAGVAGIHGVDVPRGHGGHQHLVIPMTGHGADGGPAQAIALGIELRGDDLAGVDDQTAGAAIPWHEGAEAVGQIPVGEGEIRFVAAAVTITRVAAPPSPGLVRGPVPVDLHPGTFHGQIWLVADDPDLAPLAGPHIVGAAGGKVRVEAAGGQGAVRLIAVVDAADHPQILVAPGRKVLAASVVGVAANLLRKQHPAGTTAADHLLFAAGFMDAENVGRVEK